MADAVARVLGMEDVVIEILTYLPVEQVGDGLMIATSSATNLSASVPGDPGLMRWS